MNDGIVTLAKWWTTDGDIKRMSTQDAKDRQRQRQSGKSMGEFGPDYKKTHDLVLGDKSDKFTGEWNKWKVKKEIPGKKPKKPK